MGSGTEVERDNFKTAVEKFADRMKTVAQEYKRLVQGPTGTASQAIRSRIASRGTASQFAQGLTLAEIVLQKVGSQSFYITSPEVKNYDISTTIQARVKEQLINLHCRDNCVIFHLAKLGCCPHTDNHLFLPSEKCYQQVSLKHVPS